MTATVYPDMLWNLSMQVFKSQLQKDMVVLVPEGEIGLTDLQGFLPTDTPMTL